MLLYVAGPYTAKTKEQQKENIKTAHVAACALWLSGHYAICPHTNSMYMEQLGLLWKQAMSGYKDILGRCDGVVFLPKWKESRGAKIEHKLAKKLKKKIYYWPDYPLETK